MKIAVWHNLPSGGGKRALYSQVAGLVARGHQVEAWCPETADRSYLPLTDLIPETRLPFKVPDARPRSFLARVRAKWSNERRLLDEMNRHSQACAEAILAGGFDLVFAAPCVYYRVPRLGHFLAQARGRPPLVLYLQEPRRWNYEAMPELPWIARPPRGGGFFSPRRLGRKLIDYLRIERLRAAARLELEDAKCYDRLLVNSYFSRESIVRAFGLDSRVCYLGYDASCFRRLDPPPAKGDYVIGLGSLDYIKGVDTAIRAVACLPEPRVRLIWVANSGEAIYQHEMEALATRLGVHFDLRRRIPDEELVNLLSSARLLLYTSRLEPFGYAPVEANACGVPVVAVAEGGVRETVTDGVNGLLCDRDPAALAAAMARLLADRDLAGRLGDQGERLAHEKWSPEQSIDRLEHHLRASIEAHRSRSSPR